jgi:hypothetical protein
VRCCLSPGSPASRSDEGAGWGEVGFRMHRGYSSSGAGNLGAPNTILIPRIGTLPAPEN